MSYSKRLLIGLLVCLCNTSVALAQYNRTFNDDNQRYNEDGNMYDENGDINAGRGGKDRLIWGRDTTRTSGEKEIPIGLYQWRIDERLGHVIPSENNDTVVHNFQNFNYTDGYTGTYNYLANIGTPRLNRMFLFREPDEDFLFLTPLSYFRGGLKDFRFTNTKSPITNLAYHSTGGRQNGEDRVRAYFTTNINRTAGLGFKIDYAYGRGYYNSSATSLFGTTLYGYYLGDRYNAHAYLNTNHMKMAENGGIEDDKYIEDPESFSQNYNSTSIPVTLDRTWNRNHEQNYYLTHRYNLGFTREIEVPDSLKPVMPSDAILLDEVSDSIRTLVQSDSLLRIHTLDSLRQAWEAKQVIPTEFIPVSSIIHTFDIRLLDHSYIAKETPNDYYTNHYYGDWNSVQDDTHAMSIRNTFGLSLREGFNRWAAMGLTAFATHRLRTYRLPRIVTPDSVSTSSWTANDLSVGGEISRTQGRLIHYNALAEFWLIGERAGDFNADGRADLTLGLGRFDTLCVDAHARIAREIPSFYYRHYHSQSTWYDNDFAHEFRTKFEGTIQLKRFGTRIHVGFENVTNYTYFAMQKTLKEGRPANSQVTGDYTHAVTARQKDGSVQVLSASLAQDMKWRFIHLDAEVSFQTSTDKEVLPLPALNIYANAYVLFPIARVLRFQAGADMRYFTRYYAPDYAPSIQNYAIQDASVQRTQIGNYPILNVYLNLHLKRCRLYAAVSHVNAGSGHYFLAPHYPINPLSFRFGLSWNLFN